MRRTHTCGELTDKHKGKNVCLEGWVSSIRNHGGMIFVDIRDRYGFTQIVFDPKCSKDAYNISVNLRNEDVISIKGKIKPRHEINPKSPTGKIEVFADEITVLNRADVLPLDFSDEKSATEETRLRYRYLDLRRPELQKNIILRHKIVKSVRDYFDKNNFLEIETPMLARSTPEGARDYLVPSRVSPGRFYALPQSPQLFKQLLMISGFDRYFQIVRCFRDEDLRADRQPEFTQIDVEMAFAGEEDIYSMIESLMMDVMKVIGVNVKPPFPRLTYEDALDKYGVDRPDTRFDLHLIDISDIAEKSDFEVFKKAVKSGGCIKCINAKGCADFSRKDMQKLEERVKVYGAKGLAFMKLSPALTGSIVKFFSQSLQKELIKLTNAKENDLLLFVAAHKHFVVNDSLGNLRVHLAKKLNLIKDNIYNFVWVTDFPLVEFDEDEKRHIAIHHPFTSPKDEDLDVFDKHPSKASAKAYDLVLNGVEIGGGSIRIHKKEVQQRMFKLLGISDKEAKKKFGFLLEAFRYGAPPHGGIAFGLDRVCAVLAGEDSIRDVIAFPKNKAAMGLMDECPNTVDDAQLKELNIKKL